MSRRPNPDPPRTHWVLLSVVMIMLLAAMVIAGIAGGQVGEGARSPASRSTGGWVPESIRGGGPVIDANRPEQAGLSVPDRHVVLTFDDGPTEYTAEILDVLAEEGVPATFFVVGAQAADRPDLMRRMLAEGHEVGVHTFTHANLANVSALRQRIELDQTQLAIAAATGRVTGLLRPPYSSEISALLPADWQAIEPGRGLLGRLHRPGHPRLGAAGSRTPSPRPDCPAGDQGAIVTMHDGGGDRDQTVAALRVMIDELRARGYTFDTVSSAVGLSSPWHTASLAQRLQGHLVSGVVRLATLLVGLLKIAFMLLAALAVVRTVLLVLVARRHERERLPARTGLRGSLAGGLGRRARVQRGARASPRPCSPWPPATIPTWRSSSSTTAPPTAPSDRGRRAGAARRPADPAGQRGQARRAQHRNPRGAGTTSSSWSTGTPSSSRTRCRPWSRRWPTRGGRRGRGNTKVGNRRGLLGRWQHIEYVIGFNLDRRMFDVLRVHAHRPRSHRSVPPGGPGRASAASATTPSPRTPTSRWRSAGPAGGWSTRPRPAPGPRPRPRCGQLWRQRYRWCYGTMQAMWKHRGAVRESGAAGKLGRRGLPYLFALPGAAAAARPDRSTSPPLYAICLRPDAGAGPAVWLAFLAMQLLAAAYAFRLDGEWLRPLWSLPLQQFVYRQLMYLVVVQSVASAFYGLRLRWQAIRRTGEMDAVPLSVATGPPS